MKINFIDEIDGYYRAEGDSARAKALAFWLNNDLLLSEAWCEEILLQIKNIKTKDKTEWGRSGNTCTFEIKNNKAFVQHVWPVSEEQPIFEYTLDEIENFIQAWLTFINDE